MTVLNTNTAAINAQYNLKKVQNNMEDAMAALSSGKRINTAADDAAGIAIASRMTAAINGFEQAIRNASDAQGMIDTAEGAHDEVSNMLQRMRELAVQSGNDSNSDSDRAALQLEIDQLLTEMDRISARTIWGGKTLMGGETGGPTELTFQVGATSAAGDQISINIDDTSSKALGIGGGEATFGGGRDTGPAGVSYDHATGVLSIVGQPENGDNIIFDVNGLSVTARISYSDQYPDNAKGAAAQIKAEVDKILATTANNSKVIGMSVTDNGDGTLTFNQQEYAVLDTFSGASTNDATIDAVNGTITFDGTYAVGAISANVNGTAVSVTRAASDGFEASNIGTATAFRQALLDTAGLENLVVTDYGDGSLKISNGTSPYVDGLEISHADKADVTIAYDDAGVITVGGVWTEGQKISMDILGETVSIEVKDDDSYANTLGGITEQLSAAINDKGISGLTSAKTANASTLTLTADVNAGNATVDSGSQFITHTLGDTATVVVGISGTDVAVASATAATYTAGDKYSFEVLGNKISFVVGADGYSNDKEGVAEQMKDLVDDLNIEGLAVTVAAGTTATISMARALTGTATTGSTVVTNIESLSASEAAEATFSGGISVETAEAASDAIDRIDAALVKLQEQRAELGSVSNRLDHTITNLSNVNVNLQASRSRIEDADFAAETSNLTKNQILSQAATAMLAQANASKQSVLSLLQG